MVPRQNEQPVNESNMIRSGVPRAPWISPTAVAASCSPSTSTSRKWGRAAARARQGSGCWPAAALAPGQVGELACRGDNVMLGYYQAPEVTAQVIDEEGWYYTGDLGSLDEDNYLRIAGRIKDMIIRAGQNIYPAELESVLVAHNKISQTAIVGVPDDIAGEKVVAFIIPNDEMNLSTPDVFDFCRENLAPFKVPHEVYLVEELPMTPTGKVLKRVLRDQLVKEILHKNGR